MTRSAEFLFMRYFEILSSIDNFDRVSICLRQIWALGDEYSHIPSQNLQPDENVDGGE